MTQLEIKNKLFLHPAKRNNIIDINLDKISVENILSSDHLGIYYIRYDENVFYLVIDDIKDYFETKLLFSIMKNMKKYLKTYRIK